MRTIIDETGQAFSDFVNGIKDDLYEGMFTGNQVAEVEKMLLTRITILMQVYAYAPEDLLKDIAEALTEDSIASPYFFNEETGALEKHRAIDVYREYKAGTKANINLNPYIAQYERI